MDKKGPSHTLSESKNPADGKISGKMATHYQKNNWIFWSIASAVLAVSLSTGCASTSHNKRPTTKIVKSSRSAPRRSLTDSERQRIAAAAKQALGKSRLSVGRKKFRGDCSGTVRAIFARAQIGLGGIIKSNRENDVKAIYRYVQKYGAIHKSNPRPGELVFFHNTYDRSRNGRMNDALTHIGVVERVEGTTVHFIHHLGQSIIRSRMDTSNPRETFRPKSTTRINDILRRAQGRNRAYTAGELFAGFGRL